MLWAEYSVKLCKTVKPFHKIQKLPRLLLQAKLTVERDLKVFLKKLFLFRIIIKEKQV